MEAFDSEASLARVRALDASVERAHAELRTAEIQLNELDNELDVALEDKSSSPAAQQRIREARNAALAKAAQRDRLRQSVLDLSREAHSARMEAAEARFSEYMTDLAARIERGERPNLSRIAQRPEDFLVAGGAKKSKAKARRASSRSRSRKSAR
jgi:hypothetical protein